MVKKFVICFGTSCFLGLLLYQSDHSSAGAPAFSSMSDILAANFRLPFTTSGPIPAAFFGMHVMEPRHWPTVPFGALGKGTGVTWDYIEPKKGQFDWLRLDRFVNDANAHGLGYMFSADGVPPWAASDRSACHQRPPFGTYCLSNVSKMEDWDTFVRALVTRYKGRIQVYELWNEPQNGFVGTVSQMVALTQHEHDIIRSLDPTAKILSPSAISYGAAYLDNYFAEGGTKDIDAVAMHAYPNPSNDVAEFMTGSVTDGIKKVMNNYGLANKPIWDTEGSWGDKAEGAITDPDLQAAFVARDYLLHWSVGISRFYWYGWDNSNIGCMWSESHGPSKAAQAYEQVRNWMTGALMTQPCSANGVRSAQHGVYTCDLTRSGAYQATAVWNTEGSSTYKVPSQFRRYRDLAGETCPIPGNDVVPIGFKPILLETF